MKGEGLKLDLYNFDQPQHQAFPYILTSPRSLEACRRLGIKPLDLLYQGREEYDAAHPDQPLQQRLVTYHSQERRRLKRLREARELRDRLLLDEERSRTADKSSVEDREGATSRGSREKENLEQARRGGGEKREEEEEEGEIEDVNKKPDTGSEDNKDGDNEEERGGNGRRGTYGTRLLSLDRQDSQNSTSNNSNSSSGSNSTSNSKQIKERENLARSLVSREASTTSWEDDQEETRASGSKITAHEEETELSSLRKTDGKESRHPSNDEEDDDNEDDISLIEKGDDESVKESDESRNGRRASKGEHQLRDVTTLTHLSATSNLLQQPSSSYHISSTSSHAASSFIPSSTPSHAPSTSSYQLHTSSQAKFASTSVVLTSTNTPSTSTKALFTSVHIPRASSLSRKPKSGAPRPSSAQKVKQGGSKAHFNPSQKRIAAKEKTIPFPPFSRIPGEPYRSSVTGKSNSGKNSSGKKGKRPYSATSYQDYKNIPRTRGHQFKRTQITVTPASSDSGRYHQVPSYADCHQAQSSVPPARSSRPNREGCGTWPGGRRDAAATQTPAPHRPRITWASTPPRYHGSRQSSESTSSPASSLSDIRPDPHHGTAEPEDSDDGTRSANSTAECDRQEGDLTTLLKPSFGKSSDRLEPKLPTVSVVGPKGAWSPRSDTTSLTPPPPHPPRHPRRRATTSSLVGGRRVSHHHHRRVSSARPASASLVLPPSLSASHSLDEIALTARSLGGGGSRSGGVDGSGGEGPWSLELPRPHSAASFTSGCHARRKTRPASALARPASDCGDGGSGGIVGWSPRLLPQHRSASTVSLADSSILAKYMQGVENTELPARDLRMLELLARKHEKLYADQQRSQQAHRSWLLQREHDTKAAAAQWADWRWQVNDKRRKENEENVHRWRRTEERYLQSQENLASLITGKERRARELLHHHHMARIRRLEEKRASEDARKSAQEAALKAYEEAEERKRQHLLQLWEQQQQLVEQRKREREDFFRKRVADDNQMEVQHQAARRRLVEARGQALLEAMRTNMEERLTRADDNLRMLHEVKEDTLRRQRDERDRRGSAVRALHDQLEASMMQWRRHILTQQLEAMAGAEARQGHHLITRANRIHADLTSRHIHHNHLLQQVMAREDAELEVAKRSLEAKDARSMFVAREKERVVARARSTAFTTASLRENLRKKLSPETFDKVVARANLELRIENRPPATTSLGTRSHIFLG